jgi:hypothetical protein
MLDEGDDAAGHEATAPYRPPGTRDLGHLDDAATGAHLDATAGTRGDDLEALDDAVARIDQDLDSIALHGADPTPSPLPQRGTIAAILDSGMSSLSLDFLYLPSRDVAADVARFRDVLGAEVVFAIDSSGTRVAMVRLTDEAPALLLADHIGDDSGVLVYRVTDLAAETARLRAAGWDSEAALEVPPGPCVTYRSPGGTRIALYERSRPDVLEHFRGRIDF